MKINFDLELILKMINEEGKMLKEIQEYYGCKRSQLSWFLKKNNLNFKNNKNARKNQSKLMSGEMNPTKGRKRKAEEMEGIKKYNYERTLAYWNEKYKNGITFKQYAKMCRGIIPRDIKNKTIKFELEVDHIFSIKDCWNNKIFPYYASDIRNLRLISSEENKKKGSKSLLNLESFLLTIGVQRLSKAQFNWKRVE